MKTLHIILTAALLATAPAARLKTGHAQVNPLAAAQQDFQARLTAYLALRADLAKTLGALASTTDAVQLARRQQQLATAMQKARPNARPGDLFTEPIARHIADTVNADLRQRAATDQRAAFEEVPARTRPVLNRVYPADKALATVPPLILVKLPRLPDNLQYRFFDRHIVLLDGDTDLIIDYILNVLPPLAQGDPDHQ